MKNKKKLLIIGASGHGKVVADIAIKINKWQSVFFLDDDENLRTSMGIEIIGKSNMAFELLHDYDICVAIGNNDIRKKIQTELEVKGASLPVLIHPTAVIGDKVNIDSGTVVMAGAVINCCSDIGNGCIINTGSTIDHDNNIGDFVHISPGAHLAGSVSIGQGSWLGIGSIVSNDISIINNCIIGAGAVVVRNINESGIFVGIPAKKID